MTPTPVYTKQLTGTRPLMRIVCPAFPAFNIYSRPARAMTALGPVCVATAVHDIPGWDAEVIDENNYRRGPKDEAGLPDHEVIQQTRPAEIVGFYGGLTSTIPRLLDLAARYQAMGTRTIAGGHHFVEDTLAHALHHGIDIIVLGEGEETIVELLACLDTGGELSTIRGIAFLRDGEVVKTPPREPITDFDKLPIPDFSVLRYAKMKFYPVSGVRGCAMKCEFCAVKGKPRFASPERLMEQIASIHERWSGRIFFIVDDLFGQNRADTLRLCQMLREYQDRRRVKFSIMVQIRLDRARDPELLTAMRDARINSLAIGFETPIAEELQAMHKGLKPQEMIDLATIYRRAGFRIHGMFIFGYPAPTDKTFYMSAAERAHRLTEFIHRARLDTIQVLLPIPLPGTQLAARLAAAGRIYPTADVGLEYYDGNFPLFEPDPPMTAEDMQDAIYGIMHRFYGVRCFPALVVHLMVFPVIALWVRGFRARWERWRCKWLRIVLRCGGFLTLKKWTSAFKTSGFLSKLAQAQRAWTARRAATHR